MSRTRRNFSAKFKSELVIDLLKGEKDLNTIAIENNIQPNLLSDPIQQYPRSKEGYWEICAYIQL